MKKMTMDELSQLTNGVVSKPNISKYEAGKMMPSSRVHILLAQALGMDFDYFFRPVTVEITRPADYRKKSKLSKSDESAINEEVKDKVERYMEIEDTLGAGMSPFYQPDGMDVKNQADVKRVVTRIRSDWQLGLAPLSNVIDLLEAHGLRVIEIDAPDAFDGMCIFVGERKPVLVLNRHYTVERKRFNALHEFGHSVMRLSDSLTQKEREGLCNYFASEMLLSSEVLCQIFGKHIDKVILNEIRNLQTQFGISIEAIMHRLKDEHIMSDALYRQFCIRQNMNAQLKAWAKTSTYLGEEKSYRFPRMVYRALSLDLISEARANEILGTNEISYIESKQV
ncbi:MAG: ImmA/IrrE family metallo-endopeptidase [Bacteroidaceae bacterium]|nr:ImmA/IrrE family metallo-endopeptidase [Bacteroidaceae bacterium]